MLYICLIPIEFWAKGIEFATLKCQPLAKLKIAMNLRSPGASLHLRLLLAGVCGHSSWLLAAAQEEVVVTARQVEESRFATPYAVELIGARRIEEVAFRSTPAIFREVPGSLVQKTSQGQGSPYLRGFTGCRNLFMVDGIRLNNAVFRDGPNQYWNTVDPGSIQRLEIVRGPGSVLYGSDAIGGTVNVLSRRPQAYLAGDPLRFSASYRYSSGDDSHITRVSVDTELGPDSGLLLMAAMKRFGNLEAGDGQTLNNTGYDESDFHASWVWSASANLTLQAVHQQVRQDDVPRTHKTLASRSFAGTEPGTELRRNLDQERRLSYLKVSADQWAGWRNISVNLYHQRQEESRDRLRSGNRSDQQSLLETTPPCCFRFKRRATMAPNVIHQRRIASQITVTRRSAGRS